ncbi:MAG: sulfatase [Planctomycetales bacterium]|nr:sulfatase [Planctomycetales bacterium]
MFTSPYKIACIILTLLISSTWASAAPNIVLIMADDLGWSDLGCQGSRYYETPHIDALAAGGLSFQNYYVYQNCAPTRAAMMSGQYSPRTGIYTVGTLERGKAENRRLMPPENVMALPLDRITVADAMRKAGYVTGMFGKWHLGVKGRHHPRHRGFDEWVVSNGRHFNFVTDPPSEVAPDVYLADYLTDRALDFVQRHGQRDKPFFLYLPHFAVHSPLHAKPELIDKFEAKEKVGGHYHATYAAMIHSVDESVGRIVQELDRLKIRDKTVVLFTSDNGGVGGYHIPGTNQTKGTTDNAPLREGKGTLYEGGIRVPFIAAWPGHIPSGAQSDEPIAHVDLFPTFVELAAGTLPETQTLDGVSFSQLLVDPQARLADRALFWHFPGYLEAYIREATWRTTPVSVIRRGNYKLFEFLEDNHLELYDLAKDVSETQNLAASHPETVSQLHQELQKWRTGIQAAMPK